MRRTMWLSREKRRRRLPRIVVGKTIFNILDKPDLNPKIAAFIDKAINQIEQEAAAKNLLFLSETNYYVIGNFAFMFSRRTRKRLVTAL